MICQPSTRQQLTDELKDAAVRGDKGIAFDHQALNRIIAHNPADMTVTTETGLTLAGLQEVLAQHGQWLPIDPPNPRVLTIADLISSNLSGPHRFGHGTIREHLLGLTVVLGDGRLIHAGGKVVKNVAGYDLCKLFVGSRGTLGVPIEATFKVRPLPEAGQFVVARCASLAEAGALLDVIHDSPLTPAVLDLHNVDVRELQAAEVFDGDKSPPESGDESPHSTQGVASYCVVLGFEGTREEVEWQLEQAAQFGLAMPADLGYETIFWNMKDGAATHCLSTLPSRMIEAIHGFGAVQFVARAGNGVIHYRGSSPPPKNEMPRMLMGRIKDAYDPKHILPEFPDSML